MKQQDRFPFFLLLVFILFWIILAVNPYSRFDWFLENILTFLFVPVLIITYKKFRFSNLSYVLLFLFMVLHTIGSYYTYTYMPLFSWLQNLFDLSRNYYDRVVHFLFGLIFYFPVYEIVTQKLKIKGWVSYMLPLSIIVSFKTMYEILEYLAVIVTQSAQVSDQFLGMQGDIWDAQKDILVGIIGAVVSMVVCRVRKN